MAKLDHVSIAVKDWRKSRDWYAATLGLAVELEVPNGGSVILGVAAMQDDAGLTLFKGAAHGAGSRKSSE
jgi:catechol 2,3-dioxygenase-like lactoylglutathione lyase family enzyme